MDDAEKAGVLQLILGLEAILANPGIHSGAGLRKLHSSGLWEVRLGLSLRALLRVTNGAAEFAFLGTHDEVKQFLRSLG